MRKVFKGPMTVAFRNRARPLRGPCCLQPGKPRLIKVRVLADGKPNLTGVWQSMTTARVFDLQAHAAHTGHVLELGAEDAVPGGIGIVEGNEIPYLPAALAKRKRKLRKTFYRTIRRSSASCPAFHAPTTCRSRSRSFRRRT